jgi:Glycosyl transferases group 1
MNRINVYFRKEQQKYRFFKGDRYLISFIKKLLRKKKISGIEKVFVNLCKGFDLLKIDYSINKPFNQIKPDEPVIVLGNGKYALKGYTQANPIIAGIALMTHPSEWPELCDEYPVVKYLQHSDWANNIYVPYFGKERCVLWPAGIDTEKWSPDKKDVKKFDLLIYNKIRWNNQLLDFELRLPILKKIEELGLSHREIVYGHYKEAEYFNLLKQSRAMIFLCEHESQGIACCEALSMNVPVFAWDQGFCLDPNRFSWGEQSPIPATSVPFFNDSCGMSFKNYEEFERQINIFLEKLLSSSFSPRNYVLENLTLKKSAQRMLEIVGSVYK